MAVAASPFERLKCYKLTFPKLPKLTESSYVRKKDPISQSSVAIITPFADGEVITQDCVSKSSFSWLLVPTALFLWNDGRVTHFDS